MGYEMYRTWLSYYEPTSWGIVFDFRDTFFQRDPFTLVDRSSKAPNLHLFAENRQVKRVGNCIFNSGWLRCWGKETPKKFANNSVVCSGSTMGSVPALKRYTERMVKEMDKMKCHATPARTESDQGYHNYLYDTGELAKLPGVRVTHHEQGHGIVNTIGAMNGFRVPKHMKGPPTRTGRSRTRTAGSWATTASAARWCTSGTGSTRSACATSTGSRRLHAEEAGGGLSSLCG